MKVGTANTTTMILIGALVGYAILVVGLVWFGSTLVDAGGLVPDTSEDPEAPLRAANLLTAADQVITMLFTITVGLIVGVGFIFRDRDFRMGLSGVTQMIFLVALSLSTVCSVYFGYVGRMQAMRIAHYSLGPHSPIDEAIGLQALAVVLTAGAALALLVVYMTEKHGPAPSSPPRAAAAPRKPRRSQG